MAAASSVAMVLGGLLYWQYERVKFLENRPLISDQELFHLGWQELKPWMHASLLVNAITVFALAFFKLYKARRLKQGSAQPSGRAPDRPASPLLRFVCGLISIAGLGFALVFTAKFIHVTVWENKQDIPVPAVGWQIFYLSLWLLVLVVRDYQKFIHGAPSRAASPKQIVSRK
jgi:hypothetical protein